MVALVIALLAGVGPAKAGEIEMRLIPGFGGRARLERLNAVSVYLSNAGADVDATLVVFCGGRPVRREVELPRGSKKLFRLGCLFRHTEVRAALTGEGEVIERRSVPLVAVPEEALLCAWVGRTGAGFAALRSGSRQWAVVKPEELPEHAAFYEPLDAVVLACSADDLGERQKEALRAWAECGGSVAHEGPRPRFLEGCGPVVPLNEFRPPEATAWEAGPPGPEEEYDDEEPFQEASRALGSIMELRYPSVSWLAGVLFLMAFVLTPLEYFLLKRAKKLHLSWWIFGGEIAAFCAGTYLWTWSILGSTMSFAEIAVADPLPSGRERVRGAVAAFVPAATTLEFSCRGVVWDPAEGSRHRYATAGHMPGTLFDGEGSRLSLRATQWSQVGAWFDVLRPSPPAPKIERTGSGGALSWRVEAPGGARCWAVYRGKLYSLNPSARRPDHYRACAALVHQLVVEEKLLPPGYDRNKDALILVVEKSTPVCAARPAPQETRAFVVRRYVDKGE